MSIDTLNHKVNPLRSASLVSKICIPSLLFGAELWSNLSRSDITNLERFVRFAAKKVQRFPTRTRTDICLSMLGWRSMISEINARKLSFLGRLCKIPTKLLAKQVFNLRLASYCCTTANNQKGFIPDIVYVLETYKLSNHLINYIQTGDFPTKNMWKRIYKTAIYNYEQRAWSHRIEHDDHFRRFRSLHTKIERAIIWECAQDNNTLKSAYIVSSLWTEQSSVSSQSVLCHMCGTVTEDPTTHLVTKCERLTHEREKIFTHILETCGQAVLDEIRSETDEVSLQYFIGKRIRALNTRAEHKQLLKITIAFTEQCIRIHNKYFK